MTKNYRKICTTLNYVEHVFIFASAVTVCGSNSVSASLVDISIAITSSTVGLKVCGITAGIKNYKSIIKKKNKKHIVSKTLVEYLRSLSL